MPFVPYWKRLVAFDRVIIAAGATSTVTVGIDWFDLAMYVASSPRHIVMMAACSQSAAQFQCTFAYFHITHATMRRTARNLKFPRQTPSFVPHRYDADMTLRVVPGNYTITVGGASNAATASATVVF